MGEGGWGKDGGKGVESIFKRNFEQNRYRYWFRVS